MIQKQTAVGIFFAISLLCVAYLTIKVGKMELFNNKSYTVSAEFSSVAGLRTGAHIEIAGVEVGRVAKISLDQENFTAHVEMLLNDGLTLSDDTIASIKTSGLIGDKFINLEPGSSNENLTSGSHIEDTESAIDFESLINKFVFGAL